MDSHTRKELKTDHFVEEVGHGFEFLALHRRQTILIGGIVAAILAIAGGFYAWTQSQRQVRMDLLSKAYLVQGSPVGPTTPDSSPAFPTVALRDQAAVKAFQDVVNKYPNTEEGRIAKYFLGTFAANEAKWSEAEKLLKEVGSSASANTASLANYALAQIYAAQNKIPEAEKLLRPLIDKPTTLISKEQASLTLGRMLLPTRREDAKKILEPLRGGQPAISRAAVAALGTP
jgi:predicted negative regulator of RcsB-dependent stress response